VLRPKVWARFTCIASLPDAIIDIDIGNDIYIESNMEPGSICFVFVTRRSLGNPGQGPLLPRTQFSRLFRWYLRARDCQRSTSIGAPGRRSGRRRPRDVGARLNTGDSIVGRIAPMKVGPDWRRSAAQYAIGGAAAELQQKPPMRTSAACATLLA